MGSETVEQVSKCQAFLSFLAEPFFVSGPD